MNTMITMWGRLTGLLSSTVIESTALLLTRVALAGIFWRSYGTKVVEGTWFDIDPTQYYLFADQFSGLPLSPDIAVPLTTYAEFSLSILVAIGLFSRFGAAGLAVMALVIQLFVFPNWEHFFGWDILVLAMAGVIISRGPGLFSLDAIIARFTGAKAG